MNLISRSLSDFFRRFFRGGLEAVAVEEAAQLQADVLDAQERVFQKTIELARSTKSLRESDDEFERQLAAEFVTTLRETSQLGREMLGRGMAEGRAEILRDPLSDSASGSTSSLPAESGPKAIELSGNGNGHLSGQEPLRRKVGRPRKNGPTP